MTYTLEQIRSLNLHGPAVVQELMTELDAACQAVLANHKWHQDYDEYDSYTGSALYMQNVAIISRLGLANK